jgi:hypothetical protein
MVSTLECEVKIHLLVGRQKQKQEAKAKKAHRILQNTGNPNTAHLPIPVANPKPKQIPSSGYSGLFFT